MKIKSLSLALFFGLIASSLIHAQVIAVNFSDGSYGSLADVTGDTGYVPVVQADWNNVYEQVGANPATDGSSGRTTFVDNSGNTVSNFSLTLDFTDSYSTGNTSLGNLLNAFADQFNSMTVTGIPYASYDVYVYQGSDVDGRQGTATIGGETLSFSTDAAVGDTSYTVNSTPDADPATPAYPSANTLEFDDVSGSSFELTENRLANSGVLGFEIVEIPEPGVTGLLVVTAAMAGAVWMLRRRSIRQA